MKTLPEQIADLEALIPECAKLNSTVSAGPAGWHISHSLMAIVRIINVLKNSDPVTYKWQFSMKRVFVFYTGKIPRGKAKAPEAVQPQGNVTKDTLVWLVEEARKAVKELEQLPRKANFQHPVFGNLNKKQGTKFVRIHTQHHLDIIHDILHGAGK
jgi:hypothetical protein